MEPQSKYPISINTCILRYVIDSVTECAFHHPNSLQCVMLIWFQVLLSDVVTRKLVDLKVCHEGAHIFKSLSTSDSPEFHVLVQVCNYVVPYFDIDK